MNSGKQDLSLGEVASRFLAKLSPQERSVSQQGVYGFVRWYGGERPFAGLTAPEIANYEERLSLSDTDYIKKLELIRAFLVYAKKEEWTNTNLVTHLRIRKGKTPSRSSPRRDEEIISLTQQGYAELEAELDTLKDKRSDAIGEIRRAAADKDFRENAPLEAARQEHGQLEGRIRELEGTLKSATVIGEEKKVTPKVGIGDTILLLDLTSGEELRYTLVSPREVAPTKGKISNVSPIGKAVGGREQGEIVEVTAPSGKLRYEIKQIER
ncbi:GreA/GreB family elongation factor [Chloroflexota bacterium]